MNKSANTKKNYIIDIEQFLDFVEENELSFENSLEKLIKEYVQLLSSKFSQSTVNRKIISLNNFLIYLNKREVIEQIPKHILKPIDVTKSEIKLINNKQMEHILSFWQLKYHSSTDQEYQWIALRNHCIVLIIAELGLKPVEVVEMQWNHFEGNKVEIKKNKKYRKLEVSSNLLSLLYIYKKETEKIFVQYNPSGYIWLGLGNKVNEGISVKTIERIFQQISKELGVKVTATAIRYAKIHQKIQEKEISKEKIDELYASFGYARKSVLTDVANRFLME